MGKCGNRPTTLKAFNPDTKISMNLKGHVYT